jgi:hypothetical protein
MSSGSLAPMNGADHQGLSWPSKTTTGWGLRLVGSSFTATSLTKAKLYSQANPRKPEPALGVRPQTRPPPNGTQAHDLSRELRFESPAQVGATPFGDGLVCSSCGEVDLVVNLENRVGTVASQRRPKAQLRDCFSDASCG